MADRASIAGRDSTREPPAESGQIGSIGRHGAIYAVGTLLNRLAGFLLIPILLHTLSTQEWGTYSLILAISQFLLVVPAAMVDAMVRLHFDQETGRGQRAVTATTLAAFLIVAVLILILAYPTALLSARLFFHGPDPIAALLVANIGLVFELLFEIELAYLRIQKRSGLFGAASLARSLLQFAGAILLVVGFGMGVMGVVLGGTLAVALVSIPMAVMIARRTGIRLQRPIAREMSALTKSIAPAWFAKSALDLLEPYLITMFAGLSAFGVLAVANKLVDQLRMVLTSPFSRIWEVTLFEAGHDEQHGAAAHRAFAYFLLLLSATALGLALFSEEIVRIIAAPSFWSAAAVVPILVLSPIAKLINYHFEIALIERKQTGNLPWINALALVLAVALYCGLVPPLGIFGAALAGLLTQMARMAATLAFVARCSSYIRQFPWRASLSLLGLGIGCYGAARIVFPGEGLGPIAGKALILLAFVLLAMLGPTLRPSERRQLLKGVRRWSVARTAALRFGGASK